MEMGFPGSSGLGKRTGTRFVREFMVKIGSGKLKEMEDRCRALKVWQTSPLIVGYIWSQSKLINQSSKNSRRERERESAVEMEVKIEKQEEENARKWRRKKESLTSASLCPINNLDDGCLMHIFSFLSPIPDRYNTALVCHRWCYLACHPRLWLRVDRSVKDLSEPAVFPNIETAVTAARPGDTILIAAGGIHHASNIQIKKPLCLIGGGELPDETTLICSRGSDSALEFLSTCKLANLTVKAELGCCLLHRKGRLTIDGCILQCESNPLDYLSCPIVSTATGSQQFPSSLKGHSDGVFVSQTRIEGGAKAVSTSGDLELQRVRVIYARTSLLFWFDVEHQ
ncbi:F-box protein SKIP5 [Alnus glutinosa]|uniref:F-box protein SKIP5 n=1 Tax=Alnus glutinosa TaxID=3517 RepID=UPI002D79D599|nr:F-box protein SKIP5 [Alnus glutinosa]